MPARHTSLQDIPLLEAVSNPVALVDERGCRRDIRSNGWIVLSKEFALHENRSGRRNQFSSFGADLWSAISPGSKPAMKSGPDVFADALVPLPWLSPARQIFENLPKQALAIRRRGPARTPPRRRSPAVCPAAVTAPRREARLPRMVIVSRNGRVNRIAESASKPRRIGVFAISWRTSRRLHSSSIHRDI
jgi:hypothetical protein